MAHRQVSKLHPPAVEEAVARYEEDVGPLAHESGKGRLDLSAGTGIKDLDLQPHCTSSRFQVSHCIFGACNTGRIDEHGHAHGGGHQLAQKLQPCYYQIYAKEIDTGQVAARPGDARDKTKPDRIIRNGEDDWDCRGCRLGRLRRWGASAGGDDSDLPANQVGRQLWKPVILALRPAVDDRHILALNVADLLQTSAPGVQTVPDHVLRSGVEKPDHRHRWLLRPHRERPHGRRPAEQRDELAASYVEHGLPSWNPLCQLTAGSGCLWKRPQVLGADLICSESG